MLPILGMDFDGLIGYSPIVMAKNASVWEEYSAKFFANGAAPGGVLEHSGTIKEPHLQYVSYHNYGSYLIVNNYNDFKKNHATIVKFIATLKRATKTTVW